MRIAVDARIPPLQPYDIVFFDLMGSTIGQVFKVTNFGESHGKAVGCIIENCPSGLEISTEEIQIELNRRKPGQSDITTNRKEGDKVEIVSGLFGGKTTGSPITCIVWNKDQRTKDYENIKNVFRPSHADFTYHSKYKFWDYRGGGRSSARATIGTVAAGAIAKKILRKKENMRFSAYVSQVHNIKLDLDYSNENPDTLLKMAEKNPIRCPDQETAQKMIALIKEVRKNGDSVGGTINLVIDNVPSGLGEPVYEKIDGLLAQAMMMIPAVKGVDIGSGFKASEMLGTEHNDIFEKKNNKIITKSNYSGGIQGGITNGMPILMRVAFKPTATISQEQPTIDTKGKKIQLKVKGRHDPCVLPRAVPIVEAAAALVLVDRWLINKLSRYDSI